MRLELKCESSLFPALAYTPTTWRAQVPEDTPKALPQAESIKKLVLRAWSELAAMKLAEGMEIIDTIRAQCRPASLASIDLQGALLQAVSAALNDDAETAAFLVEDALGRFECGVAHPAISLLLRLGHWKARRFDAFSDLSGSFSHAPTNRREAISSILHLSIEAAVEAEQLRLVSAGWLAKEALALSNRFYGSDFSGSRLAAILTAKVLYEQNSIDAADLLLRDRLAASGTQAGIEGALGAYVVCVRIAAARGQLPFALLLLQEAELLGEERRWSRLVAASLAERVRLLVEDARMSEAQACLCRLARMPATSND